MKMIEKCARALIVNRGLNPDDRIQLDECLQTGLGFRVRSLARWELAVSEVRAVLTALRDPSDAMFIALGGQFKTTYEKYLAAIDAAIADGAKR